MLIAAEARQMEGVKLLLDNRADATLKDTQLRRIPSLWACSGGCLELVRIFLDEEPFRPAEPQYCTAARFVTVS